MLGGKGAGAADVPRRNGIQFGPGFALLRHPAQRVRHDGGDESGTQNSKFHSNNRCHYCAIPLIRGPLRSRPIDDCVAEARWLAGEGVKELILVAQDPTAYGEDWGKPGAVCELLLPPADRHCNGCRSRRAGCRHPACIQVRGLPCMLILPTIRAPTAAL